MAGKSVKTRLNPGHEWVYNHQKTTRVTRVTDWGLEELKLTADEARRRFGTAAVARLATIGPDGRPHLVPVTFALDGDRIYTVVDAKPKTTANLRRLRNIGADSRVTVLADHYENDWDRLWWARADGHAAILGRPAPAVGQPPGTADRLAGTDGRPADLAGPLALLAARYPQYRAAPPAGPLIRIQVERWTGWAAAGSP